MQTYSSGKSFRLTRKLNPADTTMYGNLSVGVTAGRIFFQNDNQKEWISFTGNSLVGTEYVYTGLTRGLSQTADPATSGTGLTWLANQQGVLVSMHDQIVDKSQGITPISVTTTQRDALTPSNGAFVYNTTAGLPQIYYGGAWYDFNTAGSATPNASETVAGKVEIATTAQSLTGVDTGETGAKLSVLPSDIAKNAQSGAFSYAADAGSNDTYAIALVPALTAYTTGQTVNFKANTSNTGACTININSLGNKAIKTLAGDDTLTGDISAGTIYTLVYNGTNFVMQNPVSASSSRRGIITDTRTNNLAAPVSVGSGGSVSATATTSGFVLATGTPQFGNTTFTVTGSVGGTSRASSARDGNGNGLNPIMFPVASGETWTVATTESSGNGGSTVRFMAFQ